MNILIDIGHPAHVHLFKHFAYDMLEKGHRIMFTAREKEVAVLLLKAYKFEFRLMGKPYKKIFGKVWGLFKFNVMLFRIAWKFKPDIFLSAGSMYAAQVAWLLRKPHFAFEDSGNMEQIRIYRPFTKSIFTPDVLKQNLGKKQIKYSGYHELAYLRPAYFKPDFDIQEKLGIEKNQKYCILRFVSWDATHDMGQEGLSIHDKRKIVASLNKRLRVFITSEGELPAELKKYKIDIPPERMHDTLCQAELFVGEGATMASEAGVLGTPSIYVNSLVRQYNEDQEKYGLVFNYRNGNGVLERIKELLGMENLREEWQRRRNKMLADKIDVTAFLVWFVENYPQSVVVMKENPDYQLRFK